jgi:cobalt/nickel transport system permease protein
MPLFAIHMPDGLVTDAWWIGGFVGAAMLALIGAWRMREEEIPRVAVLTAAFFVASLIHVPVPAGPRAHLLLNGLLGVLLGTRAGLAIPIGLLLQMGLFGHGGYTTLGLNSCIMALPALGSWLLFGGMRRLPWVRQGWFRALLVGGSTALLVLSLAYSVALIMTNHAGPVDEMEFSKANAICLHPGFIISTIILAGLAAWGERRLENTPEFPLGLLVGETAVLATVFLNGLVLLFGGKQDWHTLILLTFIVHLPLAMIEGVVLGFTIGFLVRVKPEMIGWKPVERMP